MFPAMRKTANQVYILPPDFNPLIEPYPLGLGYLVDRGVGRRSGPGLSRKDAPSPLRQCGRAIPRGFAGCEAGASAAEGPGPRVDWGPGQETVSGAAGGPSGPVWGARPMWCGWSRRDALLPSDVDGAPEMGMVPDSVTGRDGRHPPPDGCDLSQPTSESPRVDRSDHERRKP
jgi:hypothetical protein